MKEPIKFTVDELLSSGKKMDEFIHQLSGIGLCNMSGSAFRQVRLCCYRGGILIRSEHNVSNSCDITIASRPNAEVVPGEQDSRFQGSADPVIKAPDFFTKVWFSGEWVKRGPWEKKIRGLLQDLINELVFATNEHAEQERQRLTEAAALVAQKDELLLKAWA